MSLLGRALTGFNMWSGPERSDIRQATCGLGVVSDVWLTRLAVVPVLVDHRCGNGPPALEIEEPLVNGVMLVRGAIGQAVVAGRSAVCSSPYPDYRAVVQIVESRGRDVRAR